MARNSGIKKWIPHGCWALGVLGAFWVGARLNREASTSAGGNPDSTKAAGFSQEASISLNGKGGPAVPAEEAVVQLFGAGKLSGGGLDALIQQALRDRNPITRRLAFSKLLESLTPGNAAAVREQLVALGADADQWQDFHYSWGAIDGKAAFANAAKSPESDLAATMTGWAAANPREALALLENLPEEMRGQRDELMASVVLGLSHNDPAAATGYVLGQGQAGNSGAGKLMEIVANETVRSQGPEAASRWAAALPDGPLKGSAMGRVADAYVRRDPEAAARWAGRYAGQDYADRSIEQVGARWAESNPVAAVSWLESLPPGNGQQQGLRTAFGDWEDKDPVAAGDYLFAMAKTPQRDSAISGFAAGYAWQDPQTAIAWAQDISDPALRETSLTRVGYAFYRRDPDGALAWLETSGLPAAARQQIVTQQPRR